MGLKHLGIDVSSDLKETNGVYKSNLELKATLSIGPGLHMNIGHFQLKFFAGVEVSASLAIEGKSDLENGSANIVDTKFKATISVFVGVIANIENNGFQLFHLKFGIEHSISIEYLLKSNLNNPMQSEVKETGLNVNYFIKRFPLLFPRNIIQLNLIGGDIENRPLIFRPFINYLRHN